MENGIVFIIAASLDYNDEIPLPFLDTIFLQKIYPISLTEVSLLYWHDSKAQLKTLNSKYWKYSSHDSISICLISTFFLTKGGWRTTMFAVCVSRPPLTLVDRVPCVLACSLYCAVCNASINIGVSRIWYMSASLCFARLEDNFTRLCGCRYVNKVRWIKKIRSIFRFFKFRYMSMLIMFEDNFTWSLFITFITRYFILIYVKYI